MKIKRNVKLVVGVVIALATIIRIWYVNNVEYKQDKTDIYSIGDEFEMNNMKLTVVGAEVLSMEQLADIYSEDIKSMVDKSNIIIGIKIENKTKEEQTIDLNGIALFLDGKMSGGNMNPYLYSCINENSSKVTLKQGESEMLYAPYPYGDYSKAELIFELYPRKISVKVME